MKTVLVPGNFAVLHPGHIRLFRYAKSIGDRVIVALDVMGVDEEDADWRVGAIAGTSLVDEVVLVRTDLKTLIKETKPNFVLKGLEFKNLEFPEKEELDLVGGKLIFSSGSYLYNGSDESVLKRSSSEKVSFSKSYLERNNLSISNMVTKLQSFRNKHVAVIGDLIVDEIIDCQPIGMSAESPTLVVAPNKRKRYIGGAAIVAGHCLGLGAKTSIISVRGTDEPGDWINSELENLGVNVNLFLDHERKTTYKQRFKSGQQVLLRLNDLSPFAITGPCEEFILERLEQIIDKLDAVILSDFSYGVLNDELADSIIGLARKHKVFVSADSQTSSQIGRLGKFRHVDLITPTELEARQELRDETSGLISIAESLRMKLKCTNMILKLGSEGVLLHGKKEDTFLRTDQIPALSSTVVDTSGAGDALLASATLAFASGENLYGAGFLGSIAASIQVSRLGNIPISSGDMLGELTIL